MPCRRSARSSPTWCSPMHEVSLVAELVEACERAAAGATVRTVRVRHASAIPEDAVRQAFELLTTGTPLAAARLDLTSFDIEVRCPCGFVGRPDHDALDAGPFSECPSCGDLVAPAADARARAGRGRHLTRALRAERPQPLRELHRDRPDRSAPAPRGGPGGGRSRRRRAARRGAGWPARAPSPARCRPRRPRSGPTKSASDSIIRSTVDEVIPPTSPSATATTAWRPLIQTTAVGESGASPLERVGMSAIGTSCAHGGRREPRGPHCRTALQRGRMVRSWRAEAAPAVDYAASSNSGHVTRP